MEKHYLLARLFYRISGHLDNKYPYFKSIHYLLNDYRHKYILNKIEPYLNYSLNHLNGNNSKGEDFQNIIWVFWWQGSESMPLIVYKCIQSIKRNSGKYKVILVNKRNVKKYADLPRYIFYKTLKGYISLTEFSDILRYNLLMQYGGLWIDSTNYCTAEIEYNYFIKNKILITSGCPNHYNFYISTKWAESLIGGYSRNSLFVFMNIFFKVYWKCNDYLISYNLVDYALYYAYLHNIGNFKFYVDHKSLYNNPKMFDLIRLMDFSYSKKIYDNLTKDTHIFKLTYKQSFNNYKFNTFYFRIAHNLLK